MPKLTAPGWRSALLALVAFLVLPGLPTALRSIAPITETWTLLIPALAVCAALGWWNGGGVWLGVIAIALGVVTASSSVGRGYDTSYTTLVHGWALLLAAAFGVASLLTPGQGFFTRAISAVGIAVAAAFSLAIVTPTGIATVRSTAASEYERRTEATIAEFDAAASTPEWRAVAARNPDLDTMVATNEAALRKIPDGSVVVLPALLALESLIALALAWVCYQRMAEPEIGPEMGKLRDFRFNDQLIWGLAVGATIFFLPVFADGRGAGLNLLLFFGALYLMRGVGVLSWMTRGKWVATLLIVVTIVAPEIAAALALGVGVGDTWMDWRKRAQSAS